MPEARPDLVGIALLALVMLLAVAARIFADVVWAYNRGAPGDLPYRLEDVVFVLIATIMSLGFLTTKP
jgi:hypothetical protein